MERSTMSKDGLDPGTQTAGGSQIGNPVRTQGGPESADYHETSESNRREMPEAPTPGKAGYDHGIVGFLFQ